MTAFIPFDPLSRSNLHFPLIDDAEIQEFGLDQKRLFDVANIFDDLENLTAENPELEMLTTAALLEESRTSGSRSKPSVGESDGPEEDPNVQDVKGDLSTPADAMGVEMETSKIEEPFTQTLFIGDIIDDAFRQKLPKQTVDRLKKIGLVRLGSTAGSKYVWRSKSLKTFEEGGRVGTLDNGKGRKSNWHVPFFAYATTDDMTSITKETLRVACLLCTNLTTVQCVQSTMQRHLILKHDSIAKALTENTSNAKNEAYWKHVILQADLLLSTLMPFSNMDSVSFRSYSMTMNPTFNPYSGSRLVRVIAQNCFIPSLQWLQKELRSQVTAFSRSLVITLDNISVVRGKSIIGVFLSFVTAKWEAINCYVSMVHMDESMNGCNLASSIEIMLTEVFSIPRHCLLAVLGKATSDNVTCAKSLGIPFISCMSADMDDMVNFSLGLKRTSPDTSLPVETALMKATHIMNIVRRSPSVLRAFRALGGDWTVHSKQNMGAGTTSVWQKTLANVKSVTDSTAAFVELFRRVSMTTDMSMNMNMDGNNSNDIPVPPPPLDMTETDLQLLRHQTPTFTDWTVWSTLVNALSPLQLQAMFLGGSPPPPFSCVLYLMDLLVYSCESTDIMSQEGTAEGFQSVLDVRRLVTSCLKSFFLGNEMKSERRAMYDCMCKATLLDPRTKDFTFFLSSGLGSGPVPGGEGLLDKRRRSVASHGLFEDAINLVLSEMMFDLNDMVSMDERGEFSMGTQRPALLNVIRSIRFSTNRAVEHHLMKMTVNIPLEGMSEYGGSGDFVGQKRKANLPSEAQLSNNNNNNPNAMDPEEDRRRRIEATCKEELGRYCACESPCTAADIPKTDSLQWWARYEETYPILSQLARRYSALRGMASSNEKLQKIVAALHDRDRRCISPGLVDAIVFLYVNGTLDTSTPDDLMNSGANSNLSSPRMTV